MVSSEDGFIAADIFDNFEDTYDDIFFTKFIPCAINLVKQTVLTVPAVLDFTEILHFKYGECRDTKKCLSAFPLGNFVLIIYNIFFRCHSSSNVH